MDGGGIDFLTNRPVEGTLLAEELALGPIPAERALNYALSLGDALRQAHQRGLVHGAVSPSSILVTAPDRVSLLVPPAEPDAAFLAVTAPYRSPEQVAGGPVDSRTDVFSYGAVLYELASGKPAFSGEGTALDEAIASLPVSGLLAKSPIHGAMEGVIAGCLEKNPARRRQRIQNAMTELRLVGRSMPMAERTGKALLNLATRSHGREAVSIWPAHGLPRPGFRRAAEHPARFSRLLLFAVLTVAAIALLGALVLWLLRPRPGAGLSPKVAFSAMPPENVSYPGSPSVSPDGLYLIFSAVGPEGKRMLWLRALDEVHFKIIPGTEDAAAPFWSPDSQTVGFFAKRSLKTWKLHFTDGNPDEGLVQTLCDAEDTPGGGAWAPDGTILFSPGLTEGIYQVPSTGGKPAPVLSPKFSRQERGYRWPEFLPDGRHFIFFALTDMEETTGVYVSALGQGDAKRVLVAETNAVYAPPPRGSKTGLLLYISQGSLTAEGFNTVSLQIEGEPIEVASGIGSVQSLALAPISVSNTGVLAYQTMGRPSRQMVWLDRAGKRIAAVTPPGDWGPPRIAPDGHHAIAARLDREVQRSHLWMIGPDGATSQFTSSNDSSEGSPVWSPDGARVAFWRARDGAPDLYAKAVAGAGAEELLYHSPDTKSPTDWSRDGRFLLFGAIGQGTQGDIWALSLADHRAGPVRQTIYQEGYGTLSPDGKWLAYQCDDSGHNQVYVQAFHGIEEGNPRHWQISQTSAGLPRWRGNGRELYYMTQDGDLMAAAVREDGESFDADAGRVLFRSARPLPRTPWNLYDVSGDGERFLVNVPFEFSSAAPTVTTNWNPRPSSPTR